MISLIQSNFLNKNQFKLNYIIKNNFKTIRVTLIICNNIDTIPQLLVCTVSKLSYIEIKVGSYSNDFVIDSTVLKNNNLIVNLRINYKI